MIIRAMAAADLPAVAALDSISFSQPWPPSAFTLELHNSNARCWVIEQENTEASPARVLVAALVLWRVLDEAHIATLAVHPNFRQHGYGRTILKTSMEAAYAEGARIFMLEVRASNLAAQKLYEGFGYKVVNRRPKYYQDNGEDALLMTLTYA